MRQASRERGGAAVVERLREKRSEIEQAILTRVYAVSEPPPRGGPEYAEGLRAAVAAGVEYGLKGIERGEQSAPPIPDILLAQARLAARSGVSLDTVLRRYFAGHTLIDDFMVEEAEREEHFGPAELKRLLRSQAAIVDRLLAAVSKAYEEEAARRPIGAERRKAERIERLLAGEPLDATELGYDMRRCHLGFVVAGRGARELLAGLGARLDARLLAVRRLEGALWAWLGSQQPLDPALVVTAAIPATMTLAMGEPGEGVSGWRLTHRQARAAMPIARQGKERVVRYSEVALLASILGDELLATSLRELYLAPLKEEPDGGEVLREVLRAYLRSEHNVSSAAASLGMSRQTLMRRLAIVEERVGRSLGKCALELEAALRLDAHEARSGLSSTRTTAAIAN